MKTIRILLSLLLLAVLAGAVFVWSGIYPIGADVPHSPLVFDVMEMLRDRSVATRARDIRVPPLGDTKLIAAGAAHYAQMCTECHLAPGVTATEIRQGLYPQPPDLTQQADIGPAEKFWIIKHGLKMSAMPAWGATHDDQAIWAIVAFLEKLPGMTLEQYATFTADGAGTSEHHHGHAGAGAASSDHDATSAPAPDQVGHDHAHEQHEHSATSESESGRGNAVALETPITMDGLEPGAVPEAEDVARAFHAALAHGDRSKVMALLSADATISEAGTTQSRTEYEEHHLGEDIAFLHAARVTPLFLGSKPMGETALVGSESDIAVNNKESVTRSREMLTLRRDRDTWQIQSVRWQSGDVRK